MKRARTLARRRDPTRTSRLVRRWMGHVRVQNTRASPTRDVFVDGDPDSGAAEHVCSEHHFLGAPLRLAGRVVLRTADGTRVTTDHLKRVKAVKSHGGVQVGECHPPNPECVQDVQEGHPGRAGSHLLVPAEGVETTPFDVQWWQMMLWTAPVMREGGDEDGDDAPGEPWVDDDELETAAATEMTSPAEPSDAARRHHALSHLPFQPWCEHCVRGRAPDPLQRRTRG